MQGLSRPSHLPKVGLRIPEIAPLRGSRRTGWLTPAGCAGRGGVGRGRGREWTCPVGPTTKVDFRALANVWGSSEDSVTLWIQRERSAGCYQPLLQGMRKGLCSQG